MAETSNIRVETETLDKVKKHIIKSRHTISGFYTLAAEEKLSSQKELDKLKTKIRKILPSGDDINYDPGDIINRIWNLL